MYNSDVRVESPIKVAGVTIIPITRVAKSCWWSSGGLSFLGAKYPTVVVVISRSGRKKAFRVTGEELPLEKLVEEVPDVKEFLENL